MKSQKQFRLQILIVYLMISFIQEVHSQNFYDFDGSMTFKDYGIDGDTSLYRIEDGMLKLNAIGASSPARILFQSDIVTNATWQFHIELDFNPSSSNFIELYLLGDLDSTLNFTHGYYLQIGGTNDDIRLYKKFNSKNELLIDGQDKLLDLSNVLLDIIVTRDSLGNWELLSKINSTLEFNTIGTASDNSILTSAYWGLSCYFTATRADKFRFDDILIEGIPYPDVFAPEIDSLFISGPKELTIAFDEKVYLSPSSFQIFKPQVIMADSAWHLSDNTYSIQFQNEFLNGFSHQLLIRDISDTSANMINPDTLTFLYYQYIEPEFKDIIINEILADPSPPEELPDGEFIEIWNRSSNPQNLEGWKLSDNRSETNLENYLLLPDSLLILTSNSDATKYREFGEVLPITNWPSLNNDSDILILKDSADRVIDSINYQSSSHHPEKLQGGWTLELINPSNPCNLFSNWTSSVDPKGGSPGKINSVFDQSTDTIPPYITDISSVNPGLIDVTFSEAIIPNNSKVFIDATLADGWQYTDGDLKNWTIMTSSPLESSKFYTVLFNEVSDCFNNKLEPLEYSVSFDFEPPKIDSVYSIYHNQLELLFNEDLDITSLSLEFQGVKTAIHAELDVINQNHLILRLDSMLMEDSDLTLILYNLSDIRGNVSYQMEIGINYHPPVVPGVGDLIISEFLSDPIPSAGLPEIEFIEVQNISDKTFPLRGLMIEDSNKKGTILEGVINPGEYFILCPESAVEIFEDFGNAIGVSGWPNLNSLSDSIIIINQNKQEIFRIGYSKNWFVNDEKADGGWSLELINTQILCLGSLAWSESQSSEGGTPGKENSLAGMALHNASLINWMPIGDTIWLNFDREMDTSDFLNASIQVNYKAINADFVDVDSSGYSIGFIPVDMLPSDSVLNILISGLKDCSGLETQVSFEYYFDDSFPELTRYEFRYLDRMELLFNEDINFDNIQFILNSKLLDPEQITFPAIERKDSVSIQFNSNELFENNILQIIGLSDIAGNRKNLSLDFIYVAPYLASHHDLIISEIMATPSDEMEIYFEYVEIYNPTQFQIPLFNYSLNDLNTKGLIGYEIIEPNSYAVLVPDGLEYTSEEYFKTINVKPWPQLNKSGDKITINNSNNDIIHEVEYEDSWYHSVLKKGGGWSLEMIDTGNPCGESGNWAASENPRGGSPGIINSVNASRPDLRGPEVLSIFFESEDSIEIIFNEKLDPTSVIKENFRLLPSVEIQDIQLCDSEKCARLRLSESIIPSSRYQFLIDGVTDCNGNIIPENQKQHTLIYPEIPQRHDLVINEILFNPRPGGVDFIELYNVSKKYLKLDGIKIANEKDTLIIESPIVIEPFGYVVLTEDPEVTLNEYPKTESVKVFQQDLPSMPDEEGLLRLLESGSAIDELTYSQSMHFELYPDFEGISLERISPLEASSNLSNWTSASSLSEGATPGYRNSQFLELSLIEEPFIVSPKIFDPSSGSTHFTTIQFAFDKPGYVATLIIFDIQGRVVKELLDTDYLSQTGFVTWEGTDEYGGRVQSGPYIVYFSVFDLEGKVKTFKERVVVGSRF